MGEELAWRKSTFSGGNDGGDCVEVAVDGGTGETVLRDSKNPDGPWLRFTESEWRAFICGAAAGEFGETIPF